MSDYLSQNSSHPLRQMSHLLFPRSLIAHRLLMTGECFSIVHKRFSLQRRKLEYVESSSAVAAGVRREGKLRASVSSRVHSVNFSQGSWYFGLGPRKEFHDNWVKYPNKQPRLRFGWPFGGWFSNRPHPPLFFSDHRVVLQRTRFKQFLIYRVTRELRYNFCLSTEKSYCPCELKDYSWEKSNSKVMCLGLGVVQNCDSSCLYKDC